MHLAQLCRGDVSQGGQSAEQPWKLLTGGRVSKAPCRSTPAQLSQLVQAQCTFISVAHTWIATALPSSRLVFDTFAEEVGFRSLGMIAGTSTSHSARCSDRPEARGMLALSGVSFTQASCKAACEQGCSGPLTATRSAAENDQLTAKFAKAAKLGSSTEEARALCHNCSMYSRGPLASEQRQLSAGREFSQPLYASWSQHHAYTRTRRHLDAAPDQKPINPVTQCHANCMQAVSVLYTG